MWSGRNSSLPCSCLNAVIKSTLYSKALQCLAPQLPAAKDAGPAQVRFGGKSKGHAQAAGTVREAVYEQPCHGQGVFDMLQQFDRPEITSNEEFQQQAPDAGTAWKDPAEDTRQTRQH